MIIEYLDFNDKRWGNFIKGFPFHNIFHSPDMTKVFSESEGFEVFPCFAMENDEILACAFPILIKTELPTSLKYTKRLIMYSSPLFKNTKKGIEGINQILNHSINLAKKKSLFLEIRNSEEFPPKHENIHINNFKYIPYQNYLIDLTQSNENIWNSFDTFTRNHIRKSQKKNSIIREIEESEIAVVISLIENLYKRKKILFPNNSLLFNAFKNLKLSNNIRVIVLENESKIVGARITLNFGSTIFDWYAASLPEYSKIYPNEALVWNTLEWGVKNKYKIFDFGGGAIKGNYYGPAKFKEKFRGKLVEFGRYRYITNNLIYHFANKIYEYKIKK